jgi:hypothetical protein
LYSTVSTVAFEVVDALLYARESWDEEFDGVESVSEPVGVRETPRPMSPPSLVADVSPVEHMLRIESLLLSFEGVLCESLAESDADACIDFSSIASFTPVLSW